MVTPRRALTLTAVSMATPTRLPLAGLLALSLFLAACAGKKDPEPTVASVFTHNGRTHVLNEGWIEYVGANADGTYGIDVMLLSDSISFTKGKSFTGKGQVFLLFFNSTDVSRLVNGTYAFDTTGGSFTVDNGSLIVDWDYTGPKKGTRTAVLQIEEGEVEVRAVAAGYALTFDLLLDDGRRATGAYQGAFQNVD